MPATSPRLCITVSEETHLALKRLASAQDRPVASIIREYLEGVTPTLNDIAEVMESLKVAQAKAKEELAGSLEEAQNELQPHFEGIMGHLQALASIARSAAEEGPEGGCGGDAAAPPSGSTASSDPRYVIRG